MSNEEEYIQFIDDDVIELQDDEPTSTPSVELNPWKILVVDDDEGVHSVTTLALRGTTILDRPLELHHAYNVEETKVLLRKNRDYAVILLDVVMETEDAGLRMVGYIREEMNMQECRIILRTGQPGYAPELSIFNLYDINDYRTKSELTRNRLITSITAALRSYRQIYTISENRRGLELIIKATSDLMDRTAIQSFSQGVLTQLASLLDYPLDGIVCVQKGHPNSENPNGLFVTGAAGELSDFITHPIEDMGDVDVRQVIEDTIDQRKHIYNENYCAIYLQSNENEGAVFMRTRHIPSEDDRRLLEVFATNMSACFNNVNMLEKLNFAAYNDPLTLQPNRTRFIVELDRYANMANPDRSVALIDISHFSDLNEGLGIDAGNLFLTQMTLNLNVLFGDDCFMARVGTDVFGVICPSSMLVSPKLDELLTTSFQFQSMDIPINTHVGICPIDCKAPSGLKLLQHAEAALTRAKQNHSSRVEYFTEEMESSTWQRLEIIRQLKAAFDKEVLEVWYQPQINLNTGEIWGLEALLRWPDTEGDFVHSPATFIPLAEYSGLIIPIGEWVLDQACRDYKQLEALEHSPQHISVNVSVPQFRDKGFISSVSNMLNKHDLKENNLVLEITESLAMEGHDSIIDTLNKLNDAGILTSIDDFGTGYSSLSYLKNLPISYLKIDQAFVSSISKEDGSFTGGEIADTIIALGEKLNLNVVAEGIETEEQMAFLQSIGCSTVQGFLYAKAMPLSELKTWLNAWKAEKTSPASK